MDRIVIRNLESDLQCFALRVLLILEQHQDWSADTLAEIDDESGMFDLRRTSECEETGESWERADRVKLLSEELEIR